MDSSSKTYTPEIEAILDELTDLAENASQRGELNLERIDQLTKSLSVNGWQRHSQDTKPLGDQIKSRLLNRDGHGATSHETRLDGIAKDIQHAYEANAESHSTAPQ